MQVQPRCVAFSPPVMSTGQINYPAISPSIAHFSGGGTRLFNSQEREVAKTALHILYEASSIASPQHIEWVRVLD